MLHHITDDIPLTVATDASYYAIAATLKQNNRPVAFHSRTLSASKQKHSAGGKEAYAVVEALRKWQHLLLGRHFILLSNRKSVSICWTLDMQAKLKTKR